MGIINRSSAQITNRDAVPQVKNNSLTEKSNLKRGYDYVSATNGDSATSVYRMVSMKSNFRLSALAIICEALGAGAKVDIGAYYGNDAKSIAGGNNLNGAAIDSDFFATAVDVSGALAKTDVTNESGTYTLDKQDMPLWQALGLASDPECTIDICITVNVAIAATGLIALELNYTE